MPNKALLGNVTDCNGGSSSIQSTCNDSVVQDVSYGANNSASVSDLSQMTTGSNDVDVTVDGPPAVACYKLIEMVQKQILYVGSVFDRLMEKSRGPYHADVATNVDEVTELQEQV